MAKYNVWITVEKVEGEQCNDIEGVKVGQYVNLKDAVKHLQRIAKEEDSIRDYVIE